MGQWWRCITYAYTHGGIIHIGFNMLVLYQVGPLIESELGAARYLVLYTLTALTATGLGYLWHPMVPVVGASGSLFGLIGFAVAWYHRMGPSGHHIRNFMFRWAAFAFIFGLVVGADNAGHLGGGLGGALLGLVHAPRGPRPAGAGAALQRPGPALPGGHAGQPRAAGRLLVHRDGRRLMARDKTPVTPAVRLLRQQGVDFVPHQYAYEERGGTAVSARELGIDEHRVIKTLIMEDEAGRPLIVLMHGDLQVSAKELARLLGRQERDPL